ncbi:aspartyl/glutamyl-tRNA amidotransferase subunit A [Candidatus Woesebacteria bacterium]|nr:aspartyl/glutamyl-tRNA amidotransferase subunit A [Candidatus Woesebacteria bacterium]
MDLLGASLTSIVQALSDKKISAADVYDFFLKRSKHYQNDLNAYVTILDKPHAGKVKNNILHGIPLCVKDNFSTRGVRTTASSKLLDKYEPPYESTVTKRLLEAGATILGKNNMDAWAHGSSTETSDYGPTRNPWDTQRAPGGSSGGTTASVSAYLAPAGIGSETAGSIRQPASWCGVVGLKPTYGRVSRYGVIAMGSSFDCPGPVTTTVEDAALLLNIIAGNDLFDATCSDYKRPDDYRIGMKKKRKLTIGVPKEYMQNIEPSMLKKVEEAFEVYKKMGHIFKSVSLIDPKYAISVYTILQRAEVSSNLARYDGVRYGKNRRAFAKEAKKRIMLGAFTLSQGFYDAYYEKAQKIKTLIIEDLRRVFKDVDVLMSPATPTTAFKLGEFEKYPFFGEVMDVLNESASVAGTPAISIPVGLDTKGLPVGMQIMGNFFDEETVLNAAYQFEQETNFMDVIKKGINNYV